MIEIILTDGAGDVIARASHPARAQMVIHGEYPKGARLKFSGGKSFLWVQVDPSIAPALVYLPEGGFDYQIPQGEAHLAYPPEAFQGARHLVRVWVPEPEETARRRNLALNPLDQRGATKAYPHATANVETRGEAVFAARNVIDGYTINTFHGEWPYQSWGIGAREDAWCLMEFGRPVKVDGMTLVLRADFPHDAHWIRGTVVLSDGAEITFPLRRTGEPQSIDVGEHIVTWMRLERLIKSDDPSAFPALTEWEVYGTEADAKKEEIP